MNHRVSTLDWMAMIVLITGGLNWLVVGLFMLNPIDGSDRNGRDDAGRDFLVVGQFDFLVVAKF